MLREKHDHTRYSKAYGFTAREFERLLFIQIDPDYARANHMRGLVNERRGDDNAALADFDRAIELNPDYGAAYHSRATLHAKLTNTEQAQADIQTAMVIGSQNLESYMSENNVWHTQHMRVEDALETELER